MRITLNGEARELAGPISAAALVREWTGSDAPRGVAIAINGDVVRRADWRSAFVEDGDAVEILAATAGG